MALDLCNQRNGTPVRMEEVYNRSVRLSLNTLLLGHKS